MFINDSHVVRTGALLIVNTFYRHKIQGSPTIFTSVDESDLPT